MDLHGSQSPFLFNIEAATHGTQLWTTNEVASSSWHTAYVSDSFIRDRDLEARMLCAYLMASSMEHDELPHQEYTGKA